MPRLSVNINKIATLRNARGGNVPNLIEVAKDCERFGAEGITVHPRPDERHVRKSDVYDLKKVVTTEFNIEGYPSKEFIDLVLEVSPEQVTLVPDEPGVLTSNQGWDTKKNESFLKELIGEFKSHGIRTSIFLEPSSEMVDYAAKTGVDRIELYTGPYAEEYNNNKSEAIKPYTIAAEHASKLGIGINAGHDLSLQNLSYFSAAITDLAEVSIGHALIADAIYLGLENTIQLYLRALNIKAE